jgi:hypothetical protein
MKDKFTLHAALLQLQEQHAFLRLTPNSVTIWCPGRTVPRFIRRTIQENKDTVRAMIRLGRIEVCPSPHWHRQEWHFAGEEWTIDSAVCGICQRLAYINDVRTTSTREKVREQVAG